MIHPKAIFTGSVASRANPPSPPARWQRTRAHYDDQVAAVARRVRFPCIAGPALDKDLRSSTFVQVRVTFASRFGERLGVGVWIEPAPRQAFEVGPL